MRIIISLICSVTGGEIFIQTFEAISSDKSSEKTQSNEQVISLMKKKNYFAHTFSASLVPWLSFFFTSPSERIPVKHLYRFWFGYRMKWFLLIFFHGVSFNLRLLKTQIHLQTNHRIIIWQTHEPNKTEKKDPKDRQMSNRLELTKCVWIAYLYWVWVSQLG